MTKFLACILKVFGYNRINAEKVENILGSKKIQAACGACLPFPRQFLSNIDLR